MLNVKHEGDYDPELNIVFVKYLNKPQTSEDVDFIVSENARWYRRGKENKIWNITDITEMGMAPAKLVNEFHGKLKPLLEKHVIDYCVISSNPLEKMAALLFGLLTGEKHPIFKTKQEALDWVLKEQETRGRFIPLD